LEWHSHPEGERRFKAGEEVSSKGRMKLTDSIAVAALLLAVTASSASATEFAGYSSRAPEAVAAVAQAPKITTAAETTFDAGAADGFTVSATGSPVPAFTESGALPDGVTFADDGYGTASLSGTPSPSAGGTYSLTITAANGASPDATQSFTLTVVGAPSCQAGGASTNENTAVLVSVPCNQTAPAPVTHAVISPPAHGTLGGFSGQGKINYTPAKGYAGSDSFTYDASSAGGTSAVEAATVTVLGAPTVRITAPANGSTYAASVDPVATSFTCQDVPGGPGIKSCTDSDGVAGVAAGAQGFVGNGSLDVSYTGTRNYSVTAVSLDGQSATSTISVTVGAEPGSPYPPYETVQSPGEGMTYARGAQVDADYTCTEGTAGPGISSCAGAVGSGSPINTAQAGVHTFTVTATSRDGQSTTSVITYTVVVPAARIALGRTTVLTSGTTTATVRLEAPGRLVARLTVPPGQRTAPALLRGRRGAPLTLARITKTVSVAGTATLTLRPSGKLRRAVRGDHHRLVLRLTIIYSPPGTAAKTVSRRLVRGG
jgi:hypothetical protein